MTDVANNRIVEIDPTNGAVLQKSDLNDGQPGLIDVVAGGKMVYALSPGNGTTRGRVVVLDVSQRPARVVQRFEAEGLGERSQGLTVLM